MQQLYPAIALLLLLTLIAGLWRVLRGPTAADRMLAAQLFGTTAVACLLLLTEALDQPSLRDVALLFALLAAISAVTFVRRTGPEPGTDESSGQAGRSTPTDRSDQHDAD
jgi:multicomponent Na+:H+ antiporter subunit F